MSKQTQKLMPSHSRLTPNAATWHKKYDKNFQGPLTANQVEQYYYDGYVIVENIIPTNNIKSCYSCDPWWLHVQRHYTSTITKNDG